MTDVWNLSVEVWLAPDEGGLLVWCWTSDCNKGKILHHAVIGDLETTMRTVWAKRFGNTPGISNRIEGTRNVCEREKGP